MDTEFVVESRASVQLLGTPLENIYAEFTVI